jgi:hypothetical protein
MPVVVVLEYLSIPPAMTNLPASMGWMPQMRGQGDRGVGQMRDVSCHPVEPHFGFALLNSLI